MAKLVVAKFGGSAIGPDGASIPEIVQRVKDLKKDSKVIFSLQNFSGLGVFPPSIFSSS